MSKRMVFLALVLPSFLIACDSSVDNSKPIYGKESGRPANCRAYVQVAVDAYRRKEYSAEETMAGLERNCGAMGSLWTP